uniref:50S ribosomal protein L24 n=1 Tax=Dictyotopsis propagulifera TaxID=670095 RepID=UPI002E77B65D|nr:50S ribosomal protein L24 [Dictyotopsis propagulifera]WAM63144.1 50S ribosomal protein L24 [Dictyotopsis propagulifera]
MKNKNNKKKIHVKVGDEVKMVAGQEKGKIGLIKKIYYSKSKVIVEGINFGFKHSKSTRPGQSGEIKRMEFPIHSSNVAKCKE